MLLFKKGRLPVYFGFYNGERVGTRGGGLYRVWIRIDVFFDWIAIIMLCTHNIKILRVNVNTLSFPLI